jgi:two-component system, sensor histidine kinase and response regulator
MEISPTTILIVDDNPKNLQILGKTLEKHHYKVEFSLNGESALSWMKSQKFDLILLDIMMPGMTGLQVCKEIRSNIGYDDIPVIFISADADKETILQGFEIGGQDYITKPFDARELMARVRTHLELKSSKEQLKEINQLLEEKVKERTLELEKANSELKNIDIAKTEFLNIIGHEVRTALNGIVGPIQLLKHELNDDKLPNLINILDISVSRLEKFSLTALTITELKTGNQNMMNGKIKMSVLIQNVLDKVSKLLNPKNNRIQLLPFTQEIEIKGDLKLLTICIENIIENAIKYSPAEGVITMNVKPGNKLINCEISDQGKGFSESALNNLFKLFMPGEPHIDRNIGLGLAFSKLIMEAHSGKIEVENIKDEGALVRLIFPEQVN